MSPGKEPAAYRENKVLSQTESAYVSTSTMFRTTEANNNGIIKELAQAVLR